MLSADRAHRLLSLLNGALQKCKEEEKHLEQEIRQFHRVLRDWKIDEHEDVKQDGEASRSQALQAQPSVKEIQEVEMLNKALEKALKVRASSKPGASGSGPPSKTKPELPRPPTTEKSLKPLAKSLHPGTKSAKYHLNPPYRTNPEKRRLPVSEKGTSNYRTQLTLAGQLTSERAQRGNAGDPEPRGDSSGADREDRRPDRNTSTQPSVEAPEVREPQHFTLKQKGHTLKLPAKYRQLYTTNSRLWEKYYDIQRQRPFPQPTFIQKLQTTFVPGCPSMSLSELEEGIAQLESDVECIKHSIDGAKHWHGTGDMEWQEYRLLMVYKALQEELSQHISALQPLKLAAQEFSAWEEGHPTATSFIVPRTCPILPSKAPAVLVYSHPSELSELMRVKLRVSELKQKIYLQKVLNKELLSELESQCHSAPDFWLLYRSIYTLLCEGGETFPVLVHEDN
ncbi:tubulin epsilon and delta complex protein 2 [Spea bombifrons]|uniref:tubulin epsilon and delta complex protein 2 n=1 Tax=Spea bombifrons TaxID=233779 RepID=UPI0023495F78|nr:tubulin epsilon and delta complex protein 2 [Spea bombifrons]XP_053328157.1 tubulin epsilon and delta complex protein 2 [Spea bombifrons]